MDQSLEDQVDAISASLASAFKSDDLVAAQKKASDQIWSIQQSQIMKYCRDKITISN